MYKIIKKIITCWLIISLFIWNSFYVFWSNELDNYYQQFSKDTASFTSPTDYLSVNPEEEFRMESYSKNVSWWILDSLSFYTNFPNWIIYNNNYWDWTPVNSKVAWVFINWLYKWIISPSDFNPNSIANYTNWAWSNWINDQSIFQMRRILLKFPSNHSAYSNELSTYFTANWWIVSNTRNSTIYVNVKPHITNYYFTLEDWTTTTSTIQWSQNQSVNLIMKVKDYNWCSNIDEWSITANLSLLWLDSNERLTYDSCEWDWKTAIFKKSWISTLVWVWNKFFTYTDFYAIDEDWNNINTSDPFTNFDDEDYKNSLTITVIPAEAPNLTQISLTDDYIWWTTEQTSTITFSWSQSWLSKVSLDSCEQTDSNKIFQDWTESYSNWTQIVEIQSSKLLEWANTIFACIKNDWWNIWSLNFNITKDTIAPAIIDQTYWPSSVILNNSTINFKCTENWKFKIERITPSNILISDYSDLIANTNNSYVINNYNLELWTNNIKITCKDNAWNIIESSNINIIKQEPTPSMAWKITLFEDEDIDLNWLDGRDIHITWDSSIWSSFSWFESWRLYILPSNITFDKSTHTYIKSITNSNTSEFRWDINLINDSQWNAFLWWGSYKAYISIMWTSWQLWDAAESQATTLISDIVTKANIISAKFTSDTNMEVITDTTLDTNLLSHSWSLFSYNIWWITYNWLWINSVNWTKLNLLIPSLWWTGNSWTNLSVQEWAIHSAWWWFNDNLTLSTITDWIKPNFLNFIKNTTPVYWNFYSNISFSWNVSEQLAWWWVNYINFIRTWWNTNSGSNNISYLANVSDLTSWNHTKTINLNQNDSENVVLTCWSIYKANFYWIDLAWNINQSSEITNISFDNCAPWIPTQIEKITENTLTPTLNWSIPIDDNWNGSWIKEYTLNVYNWNWCIWTINQSHIINTNSKVLNNLWTDISNYSWKVSSKDNMNNVSSFSSCDNFIVNTTTPWYSNEEIKDITINSTTYTKKSSNITIKANITNTDINHIWIDLSSLTWNINHKNVSCATPIDWITCSFNSWLVTYNLINSSTLTDWVKQIKLIAQNTSGLNETSKIKYITSDSTLPTISVNTISSPTWTIWWDSVNIIWNQNGIYDAIWINNIKIEYSRTDNNWIQIYNWANTSPLNWNLSSIQTWNDYKFRLTAYDLAWNSQSQIFNTFTIDRTNPIVPSTTITYPNWWEILKWNTNINILWNNSWISDLSLWSNPINIDYSTNNWSTWNNIAQNEVNDWSYTWNTWNINSSTLKIRITVKDLVWNYASDLSNWDFLIDWIFPLINFTYTNTPVNSSYINNSWIDITWNTSDTNINKVYYSFKNTTDWTYYNNSIYSWTNEIWNTVCTDSTIRWSNWNCNNISFSINPNIVNWNNYRLYIKSVDESWNETISIPIDYKWDIINPIVSINNTNWTYFKDNIIISWTSSDLDSGISSVKIQIKNWNKYWDWNNFVSTEQTLNTTTTNNYWNWSYDFLPNWDDSTYDIKVIAYDKSFKTNNLNDWTISVIRDTVSPSITWWNELFLSPEWWSLFIWWDNINITWDENNITDTWSNLIWNPIKVEYFDWDIWNLIDDNLENNWIYSWNNIPQIDTNIAKIRITAKDNVWNTNNQLSNSFTIDSTPPTISSIETMDMDADWKIDALNVIMSENILDSSITLANFNISESIWIPSSWETWNISNDDNFILHFNNIWNTWTKPNLSYSNWTLRDLAWKFLENVVNYPSIDKSVPRVIKSEMYDINENWKIDKIIAIFSEDISNSTDKSVWSINNIKDWMSISSVSTTWNTAIIILNEWTDIDTSVWTMTLKLNSNTNWKDLNNNQSWNVNELIIDDLVKPIIVSSEYKDIDWNYKIDQVKITLSEEVTWFNINDFSINLLNKENWTQSNNTITIDITETADDNNTWIIASLDFISWNLKDNYNNFVNSKSNINISDKVSPKLISKETIDSDFNWQIDKIRLTFSENIWNDFSSFVSEIVWYTMSSNPYSKIWLNVVDIALDEKSISDTANIPWFRIISNSTLKDLYWNNIKTSVLENVQDKVWPVITSARFDEWTQNLYLNFSEVLTWSLNNNSFILNSANSYIDNTIYTPWNKYAIVHLSWIDITYWVSEISFNNSSVYDIYWNTQLWTKYSKIIASVIINEIMNNWDVKYIELKNISSIDVDISWWIIENALWNGMNYTIPNWEMINSWWYYLIASNDTYFSLITSNSIADLNITNNLILKKWIIILDSAIYQLWTNNISSERKVSIWDWLSVNDWYNGQASIWFTDSKKWTPKSENIFDWIAPTISNNFPKNDDLLPVWNFNIYFDYSDDIWWLWIDILSDTLEIYKYNTWTLSFDTDSSSFIDFWNKNISETKAEYNINNLNYWKYQAIFTIKDKSWNQVTKIIIFYVDDFEFNIDKNSLDIWKLSIWDNNISNDEIVITIKTVWAWFNLNMNKNNSLSDWLNEIINWDGNKWFWFDKKMNENWIISNYNNTISSIDSTIIWNKSKKINENWEKNTYKYRVKYWANIDTIQVAWSYNTDIYFKTLINY